MTKPGRRIQPTALKVLKSGPYDKKINTNEVKPEPTMPDMPDWLPDEAKAEWERTAPVLNKLGLLTVIDGPAFAGYCQAYAMWREASEGIQAKGSMTFTTPNGYQQQIPEVGILNTSLGLMLRYMANFGMTPSDRVGINVDTDEKKASGIKELLSK